MGAPIPGFESQSLPPTYRAPPVSHQPKGAAHEEGLIHPSNEIGNMSSRPEPSGPLRNPKLTVAQCRRICDTRKSYPDITLDTLARRFDVDRSTIRRVLQGKYEPAEN